MSMIKNFGQAGVGTDVQFGKAGPRVVSSSGSFSLKGANSSALVALEIATPTTNTQATPRLYVDTLFTAVQTGTGLAANGVYQANSTGNYIAPATSIFGSINLLDTATKAISAELDTTQAGAGLNAAGNYVANAAGFFISTATSIFGSVNLIDAALKATTVKTDNALAATGLNSDGTYTANAAANYTNASTSLKSATNLLDTAVYRNSVKLSTTQTSAGFTVDGNLPTWSGTNYITNTTSLYTAVKALDLAVANAATAITNLGSAFNYVGTLDGGATAGSAYDLSSLPNGGKDTGDFYKVNTDGYFRDNATATAFYAKAGDGLVKNSTVSSWDKIDNTDSTVSGTTNRITVAGSTDTGYTLDIAALYPGQTSINTLGTITTGTWSANTVAVAKGGTGLTSYAPGDLIYATGTTTLASLPKGTGKQYLRINSGGTAPEYATLISTDVGFVSGNYTATNVGAALDEIKTQINTLSSNTIVSPDTKTAITASDTNGLQFFDEMASTKTEFLRLQGNATTAAFAAQGTGSNVNINLIPKGTGSVNVSNANLTGLANAATATDAVPFAQAKALFTRYAVADITEANSNINIGSINGVVLRVIVYLSTAFASGSSITVGYSGAQTVLASATDIDHTSAGVNVIDNIVVLNQNVVVYVNGTGSGAGKVIVEYLAS